MEILCISKDRESHLSVATLSKFKNQLVMDLGLGLRLWGSTVGHPSNSWASCDTEHACDTQTHRQTDGIAIAYIGASIRRVARVMTKLVTVDVP